MQTKVAFDLNEASDFCRGELIYEKNTVICKIDGETLFSHSLENIKELSLRSYCGCGTVEMIPENGAKDFSDAVFLCRFTMSKVDEIGEFCKLVNHFLKTGEENEISRKTFKTCPKCGRHYPKGLNVCLFCVDKNYLTKKTYKILQPYLAPILFSGFLLMLSTALSALIPVFNGRLVDAYFYSTDNMTGEQRISGIIITVTLMALTQLISQIFMILSMRRSNKISCRMSADLRLNVYDKIQRLSLSDMANKTTGDLMKRVTKDTETVKLFIVEQGTYALEKLIMFIVIFIILMRISPFLTFLVLLPVPVVVFAISRFWKYIHVRYEKQWRCDSRSNSVLHDIVKGIRVVKTFGSEEREIEKFNIISKKLADISISNEHAWAKLFPFLSFFMGIGEFFVLFFGGKLVLEGKISLGQLLEFTLFLAYIYQPLRWISSLPRRLGEMLTSLIKIFEITDAVSDSDANQANAPANLKGNIVFDNVRFGYKAYEPVLKDINLTVRQGEMIGLVGHSGAGKSTLINLIMRLYDADNGSISINGCNIRNIDETKYREKIGVVFQETFLFAGTVYDNIAYAVNNAEPCAVIAAAKMANAHDFIMKLPDGYNTIVGENGHNLSGGERQRISIARAVLRNPEILILDEATSALDPETEKLIQEALSKLIKGRTTFAIAHRLSTLKNADKLLVIEKGCIAQYGTHKELLSQEGIYAKLVMAQKQTSKFTKQSVESD